MLTFPGLPQCVEFIYKHVWIDGRDGERVTPAPEGPLIAPDKMAGPVFSQDWIAKFLGISRMVNLDGPDSIRSQN